MPDLQCPACRDFVVDGACRGCGATLVTKVPAPPRAGHLFPAKFPGYCHGCGDRILEDDLIGFLDEEIHCETCLGVLGTRGAKAEKPADVCQSCFQAKATNGTCGCD